MLTGRNRKEELTGFQENGEYNPRIDLQTDFVMVYGMNNEMEKRIQIWKERGYIVHLMTGVSWGRYRDYLDGKYDGRPHWDEVQKNRRYDNIIHGTSEDIPYMIPTLSYTEFLTDRIRAAVDTGVEAIHLEEPEFWVEGGYEDAFKHEWEIYYKEPWKAPHESEDAQYRASRLKAYLYMRCLDRLCGNLKEYAKVRYNRELRFYVSTHSLINYTQWRIVSPESRLLDLPAIDGYIAQIWTGTSRTPNIYEGKRKERTFETAFLEYGIMQELVRGTNRRMWFLHDPIEDNPENTWANYRINYFKTVVASLLHPRVSRFEVCPWPNRIFNGHYPREDGMGKEGIPADYATTLLLLMHTLGNMEHEYLAWEKKNTEAGLLLADSAMYQRNYPNWDEKQTSFKYDGTAAKSAQEEQVIELLDWSPFYGLALPLLKHGMLVRPVQLDNIRRFPGYLDDYRILVLSYEYMKPEHPDIHNGLAQWARNGGALIYVGDGSDTFHKVREWWNQGERVYRNPAEHLFECMGMESSLTQGVYPVGKGVLAYLPVNPTRCAHEKETAELLRIAVRTAIEALNEPGLKWIPSSALILRRGPYIIAAVMDESVDSEPVVFKGNFVNLFEAGLPVMSEVTVGPGEQILLADLDRFERPLSMVAAASRIEVLEARADGFCFIAYGPENVQGAARFICGRKPQSVWLGGTNSVKRKAVVYEWDETSSTVLFRYDNNPQGVLVEVLY